MKKLGMLLVSGAATLCVLIGGVSAPAVAANHSEVTPASTHVAKKDEGDEEKKSKKKKSNIEVVDMSYDDTKFVSATFKVKDAFSSETVRQNLYAGCVKAVQAAKKKTPNWHEYDIVQCAGMMDGKLQIGSANFTGAQLAEISDKAMKKDPEKFWKLSDQSTILPQYRS